MLGLDAVSTVQPVVATQLSSANAAAKTMLVVLMVGVP